MDMRRALEWGGLIAGAVLIIFGIGAIALSFNGRSTVRNSLQDEQIVGSADMTPAAIKEEAKAAGLTNVDFPSCDVADKAIETGSDAKCFASYMRIHALESTGGKTYSQMGRYLTASGKDTNDAAAAATDPKSGKPVENAARNLWVTETALATALNVSYMAEQLALFGLVVGIALLLSGVGFIILALIAIGGVAAGRATAKEPEPSTATAS